MDTKSVDHGLSTLSDPPTPEEIQAFSLQVAQRVPIAIVALDAEGRIQWANAHVHTLLGRDPATLVGADFSTLIAAGSHARWLKRLADFLSDALPDMAWRPIIVGRHENGRGVALSAHVERAPGPQAQAMVYLIDQSATQSLRARLAHATHTSQLLAEHMPGLMAYFDRNAILRDCNKVFADWLDQPREKMIGMHIGDILGPHNYSFVAQHFKDAFNGQPIEYERPHRFADGQVRYLEVRLLPHRGPHDHVTGVYSLAIDVTQRKQDQAHLELALTSGGVSFWEWNATTNLVRFDQRWSSITGDPTPKSYCWDDILDSVHPEDQSKAKARLAAWLKNEAPEWTAEYRVRTAQGATAWMLLRGRLVERDECERAVKAVGIAIDITARKEAEIRLAASERRFRTLTEWWSDWYWELDDQFRFSLISGRDAPAPSPGRSIRLLGSTPWDVWQEGPEDTAWADYRRYLTAHRPFRDFVIHHGVAPNPVMYFSLSGAPMFNEQGQFTGYRGVGRNVTQQVQAEQALRASHDRLQAALDAGGMAAWTWDIAKGRVSWHGSPAPLLGPVPLNGSYPSFLRLLHPEDRDRVMAAGRRAIANDEHFESDFRLIGTDGRLRWVSSSGQVQHDNDGKPFCVVGISQEITERMRYEERIQQLAFQDVLTALPNRALLEEHLSQALVLGQRNDTQVAVFFVDLDRFKQINDSLGHTIGDHVLRAAAQRFKLALGSDAIIGRFGGDEFLMILSGIENATTAAQSGEKVRTSLAEAIHVDGYNLRVTASVGMALFPEHGVTPEELLRQADAAMYRAKELGRNRVQVFSHTLDERALTRLSMENDIRVALERDEFSLMYQPHLRMSDGRLTGFEALVRWILPSGRVVPPSEFIPVCEDIGLIAPLGEWVLRKACATLKEWNRDRTDNLRIAVNVSAWQMREPTFVQTVNDVLDETGLDGHSLELELTETALLDRTDENIATLKALRKRGISIAVDDFGVGYSSLSYLTRFPLTHLKIDRGFVTNLAHDAKHQTTVRAILGLAHGLDLCSTAEGVENTEDADWLNAHGCQEAQGYLYAKPLYEDEARRMVMALN